MRKAIDRRQRTSSRLLDDAKCIRCIVLLEELHRLIRSRLEDMRMHLCVDHFRVEVYLGQIEFCLQSKVHTPLPDDFLVERSQLLP